MATTQHNGQQTDDDDQIDFHAWLEDLFPSQRSVSTQTHDYQKIRELLDRLPKRRKLPQSVAEDIVRQNLQKARSLPPSNVNLSNIRAILRKLRQPATMPGHSIGSRPLDVAPRSRLSVIDGRGLSLNTVGWAVEQYMRTRGASRFDTLQPTDTVSAAMLLAFLQTTDDNGHRWGLSHCVLGLDPSLYWWYDAHGGIVPNRRELAFVIRAHGRRRLFLAYPQLSLNAPLDPDLHMVQLLKNAEDVLLTSLNNPFDPPIHHDRPPVRPARLRFRLREPTGGTRECRRLNEAHYTHYPEADR